MNIQRWKGITWLGSLVVAGGLVYTVQDFLSRRDELAREVSDEELTTVLDSVKKPTEQKNDLVAYKSVERVYKDYDWSGKEKPKPVQAAAETPPPVPKVAVATLLKILAIKVDTGTPERSVAYVKFIDAKLAVHADREDVILRPGERLFAPYEDVRVDSITADGVVFAFDDATREKETVATPPYLSATRGDLGIVVVGPEGVRTPPAEQRVRAAPADLPPWNPEQLTQIRKNEYQVGTNTLVDLDRDYSRILSRDISYSTYKNPKTGATEGIKVNHVAPGSIPAQAGLTEGEVLKSINGHKVTSVNDAIAFVKANANSTDTWVAVFEKQGREFTRTYHSPR